MNMLINKSFDEVEEDSFELIPKCELYGYLSNAESVVSQNDKTTVMLKYEITLVGGKYHNRKLRENIVYQHQRPDVCEMGEKKLKSLFSANGTKTFDLIVNLDADQGGKRIHKVSIDIQPAKGEYGPRNTIKRHVWIPDFEIEQVIKRLDEPEEKPVKTEAPKSAAASFLSRKK